MALFNSCFQYMRTLNKRRNHILSMIMHLATMALIISVRIDNHLFLPLWAVNTFLSISLIFFYYSGMDYMFPVSQALSPILINISQMVS